MSIEIERKFLVQSADWRSLAVSSRYISQGYITDRASPSVRIRISGDDAWITIKIGNNSISRLEFEYEIPILEASQMISSLPLDNQITKVRHLVPANGNLVWEIDEFEGNLAGLIMAEIEISREGEEVYLPKWIGKEVTGDSRYLNSNLNSLLWQQG